MGFASIKDSDQRGHPFSRIKSSQYADAQGDLSSLGAKPNSLHLSSNALYIRFEPERL